MMYTYLLLVFYMALWLPPGKRVYQSNGLIIFSSVEQQLLQIACRAFLTNIKIHRVSVSNQLLLTDFTPGSSIYIG